MNKEQIISALKQAKENSKKRNFKQTVDLVINLKDIDLKKAEQQVNLSVPLHYTRGKKVNVCALVGPELLAQAKDVCDNAISVDDFGKYSNKKEIKKLANDYDYFIAQATIMPKVATVFGRVFGPKGKMPNPKAGCVVAPNANLKPLYEKLQKTIRVVTKNDPIVQCAVGNEEMKDEEVVDNVMTIYDALIHALPNEKHNIKDIYLKLTMGKAIRIGEKVKEEKKKEEKKKKLKVEEKKPEVKKEDKPKKIKNKNQ